ncbi:ATP-binding protein [Micromonospora sp. NPDC005194]|uniref:sensor histidine kinase n=1 Tax=Micromonospora sp. NPDC005194 TaxID=3156870 RepID=UPI0033BB9347
MAINGFLRPRARLMQHLGEDLIPSDRVALTELVKNAYDADASIVVIRFVGPLSQGLGSVDVWDDGHGMSEATVSGSWLEIATAHRLKNTLSESGNRRVLGAKGLGRFAAARIANITTLVTRRAEDNEIRVIVDWGRFTENDAYLDQVPLTWEVGPPSCFGPNGEAEQIFSRVEADAGQLEKSLSTEHAVPSSIVSTLGHAQRHHGTLLRLQQLRHDWTDEELDGLRAALSRLLPPPLPSDLEVPAVPEFSIYLDIHGQPDKSGFVGAAPVLSTPTYRLFGVVEEDGAAHLSFETTLRDGHPEQIETVVRPAETVANSCGLLQIDIRAWDLEASSLRELINLQVGTGNVSQVRQVIRSNSGIALYRDGFRVQPYGDQGADWLNLDLRRVNNPTLRLSQNQVSGFVFTTAEQNPELRDQANRVGLIENPQYEDLRQVLLALIALIEQRRYSLRRTGETEEDERRRSRGIFDAFSLDGVRQAVSRSPLANDPDVNLALDEAEQELGAGVRRVQEVLSRFSRLASLGALVDVILHEGNTALARISYLLRRLDRLSKASDDDLQKALEPVTSGLQTQREALSRLFRSIEPLSGRKRGRPRKMQIQSVIRKALELIEGELDQQGVTATIDGTDQAVTVDEADIIQVVVNLVRNAAYWSSTIRDPGERIIQISTDRQDDGSLTIVVADNGPGVDPANRDIVFDPYFTTRPEGMGLGLSIAGSITQDFYGGELELLSERPLGGATFRATLRRRVG